MKAHISQVVSTRFFHLRRLRQLRNILDPDLRQRLVLALILSRIDYCNTMFAGLPALTLKPLQSLINAASRYVADLGPYDGVTNTLKELHWLQINQRITYKLCFMMHSSVSGVAPSYIRGMLTSVAGMPVRERLKSAISGSFDVSRVRTRIGSQAFSVAGPTSSVEQFTRGNEKCTDDPKRLQEQSEDSLVRTRIPGYWPMRMLSKF